MVDLRPSDELLDYSRLSLKGLSFHGPEVFEIKDDRHASHWMAQAFSALLVIRNRQNQRVRLTCNLCRLESPSNIRVRTVQVMPK